MSECILWEGTNNKGYGRHLVQGKLRQVHRSILAEKYNIDYKDRTWVAMHLCDNKLCINPEHLMVGTDTLNVLDVINKGNHAEANKTHCAKGHPFSGTNLIIEKTGKRKCRTCRKLIAKKYQKRKVNSCNQNTAQG